MISRDNAGQKTNKINQPYDLPLFYKILVLTVFQNKTENVHYPERMPRDF